MPRYQKIISLSPCATETLLALGAAEKIIAVTEQKSTRHPIYAALTKIKKAENMSIEEIKKLNPDVLMVSKMEKNTPLVLCAEKEGIPVECIEGETIAQVEENICHIGRTVGRSIESEKLITRMRYGFSVVREQTKNLEPICTAFFVGKNPYAVAAGKGLITELLAVNNMENVYRDIQKEISEIDLSTLKILDPQIILLPSFPVEMTDDDAFMMGKYTEHALTVFVPGEYFMAGEAITGLGEFFHQLNEKMRRFSSDNLANRGVPTYF